MANVTIRIPTPLRSFVEGRSEVEVRADTPDEALERLAAENDALRRQLFDDAGELRRYVNVYVDDRNFRDPEVAGSPLAEGSELRIVPSIAGGARSDAASAGALAGEVDGGAEAADGTSGDGREPGRPAASAEVELTPAELQRYSRHLMIPEVGVEGQRRLKASSVLLVGAGGLGSPLGLYLAAAGVGRIGIVDHDAVDVTNLQRQVLHDTAAVGAPKLASARRRLEALNPHVEVVPYETRLEAANALEIFEGWNVVVDGSDNFPTRYLVNDAGVLSGTPTVYGAIFRFEGQASVFGTPDGPCYRCLFRDPPPPGLVPSCADAGVLGVLPGIVGTIQAAEAIKLLLRRGRTLAGRLLLIDALRMEFRELTIRRDPECPVCGDAPTVTELIDYDAFCGAGDEERAPEEGEEPVAVPEIDVEELRARLEAGQPFQLVDVREPYEWEICNLGEAGARLIPQGRLAERADELDPEEELVVYCRTGQRSAQAVRYLRALGYRNAVNLAGGIMAWAEAYDPDMPRY